MVPQRSCGFRGGVQPPLPESRLFLRLQSMPTPSRSKLDAAHVQPAGVKVRHAKGHKPSGPASDAKSARKVRGLRLQCSWGIAAGYLVVGLFAYEFLFRPALRFLLGFFWR
jgi:hypothetical protein